MIACDEVIAVMDIVSTRQRNTIETNITKSCHSKKIRYEIDSYILHTVLLAIILLLIITIICHHYAKCRSKQKSNNALTNKNGK